MLAAPCHLHFKKRHWEDLFSFSFLFVLLPVVGNLHIFLRVLYPVVLRCSLAATPRTWRPSQCPRVHHGAPRPRFLRVAQPCSLPPETHLGANKDLAQVPGDLASPQSSGGGHRPRLFPPGGRHQGISYCRFPSTAARTRLWGLSHLTGQLLRGSAVWTQSGFQGAVYAHVSFSRGGSKNVVKYK